MENRQGIIKLPNRLKVVAVIMLIDSIYMLLALVLGDAWVSTGLKKQAAPPILKIFFLGIAIVQFLTSLGIFSFRKIAVYGAIIFSSLIILGNLSIIVTSFFVATFMNSGTIIFLIVHIVAIYLAVTGLKKLAKA